MIPWLENPSLIWKPTAGAQEGREKPELFKDWKLYYESTFDNHKNTSASKQGIFYHFCCMEAVIYEGGKLTTFRILHLYINDGKHIKKLALPHTLYTGLNCFPLFLPNNSKLVAELDGIWWVLMQPWISRSWPFAAEHQKKQQIKNQL